MKRVLITGATGFIGRACIDALRQKDFEIHAISSQPAPQSTPKIAWYQVNLHDHLAVKELIADVRAGSLLHLAWYVKHGAYWSSDENLRWVASSLNLVEEFINNGGQRLVCAGTCAEYDWSERFCRKSLSEKTALINPSTVYGASKAGLSMIINALSKVRGVNSAWARIFAPYGPYEPQEKLIPNTIVSLLQKKVAICNNPDLQRDFIFVDDIAEIMARLVDSQLVGPINIASGQAVKLRQVVGSIASLLGTENLVEYKAHSRNEAEPPLLVGDIIRLKDELGYIGQTTLEEGLQKTIAWWKQNILNSVVHSFSHSSIHSPGADRA